jgi:peptidoglycan/xylan/chitin deacetylase (PgdA/CDA1 family)
MLHSWYGVKNTELLAKELIANDLVTYTYSQIYELYDSGKCAPKNAVLISLDDFYSVYENKVLDMANVFVDYGLVMTLGLITRTESYKQDLDIWNKLKDLQNNGFEIASHSSDHYNPYDLDERGLRDEIIGSHEIICEYLEKCPETYILPYGAGWDYDILLGIAGEKYRSVVSIAGPSTYGGQFFVMKRISPGDRTPSETIEYMCMEVVFPWFPQVSQVKVKGENENIMSRKVRKINKILSGLKVPY